VDAIEKAHPTMAYIQPFISGVLSKKTDANTAAKDTSPNAWRATPLKISEVSRGELIINHKGLYVRCVSNTGEHDPVLKQVGLKHPYDAAINGSAHGRQIRVFCPVLK
jgi:hypothetical protein